MANKCWGSINSLLYCFYCPNYVLYLFTTNAKNEFIMCFSIFMVRKQIDAVSSTRKPPSPIKWFKRVVHLFVLRGWCLCVAPKLVQNALYRFFHLHKLYFRRELDKRSEIWKNKKINTYRGSRVLLYGDEGHPSNPQTIWPKLLF